MQATSIHRHAAANTPATTPWKQVFVTAAIAISAFGISACSSMSAKERDVAVGTAVGGVVGAVATGGSTVGTVGGAVAGGVIANEVNKKKK